MVRVNRLGGIIINGMIVCDGHDSNSILRIQSHIHTDHLSDFGSSKQQFDIVMTKASKEYLALGKGNMDIMHRPGIIALDYDSEIEREGHKIRLLNNEHCLGSAQIEIVTPEGVSYGYSGDFNYPMEETIKVDNLIVDGSCGGLFKYRNFTRTESLDALIRKLSDLLEKGPVIIRSHKGLIEKLYFWTSDFRQEVPRLASEGFIDAIKLHEKFSYGIVREIHDKNGSNGVKIQKEKGKFIQFAYTKEQIFSIENKQVIDCDRWIDQEKNPIREISNLSYHISMSDHADFSGTLDYIKKVNPRRVYIDGVRSAGYSEKLKNIIENECNLECNLLIPE